MSWRRWRWWHALSLRGRITLVATGLFAIAVVGGALITLFVVRLSLTHTLDAGAIKTGDDVAALVNSNRVPNPILATSGGVVQVQVVDSDNRVVNATPGGDFGVSMVSADQLRRLRAGARIDVIGVGVATDDQLRVIGVAAGAQTVLVATDAARVEQAVHIVSEAALVGGPIAILVMALLTYWVVGQTLRPVAALRHGAEEITATGLTDQRLPVPDAQDEIHRLAETLNTMLERITASSRRQRTFVGDAAHELRSPLASLRVQLEVAGRLGPAADWQGLLDDVLLDVDRLEQLVTDLLVLARSDEQGGALRRREPVEFGQLVYDVVAGYETARVPVDMGVGRPSEVTVIGDRDSLRRIVVNLIDNAVRYAATTVTVRLERTPAVLGTSAPAVQLAIGDDGPGIAAGERERVFDRFYRTAQSRSRESGGTGLGLPIVRELVRAHGGTVYLTANSTDDAATGAVTDEDAARGEHGLLAVITLPVA